VVTGTIVKKRGGKDYRLDAKLSISGFKEIILSSILYHNQYHVMKTYDRSADMPVDLPSVPLELWNWGIQHRTGRLRSAPEEAVRLSLLPRADATVSDLGICIFGIYYTCQEAIVEGWMHRAQEVTRPQKVLVAYDPNLADEIYLFPSRNSAEHWVCKLSVRSREFVNCTFWEVWQRQEQKKYTHAESKVRADKHKRKHEQRVIDKIRQAEKLSPDTSSISNTERIGDIRSNRKAELQNERDSRKPKIQRDVKDTADIIPLHGVPEEDYDYPSYVDELFDDEDDNE
ncbi:Mu transposase C-terminal domain-containing protein, partial [Vibrio anguillarum]|uniref:Mu transposase C-terminal domain-containing protein n=1 Tax=Vibrio anguillarum TaxID=55601 RepID=UPI00188C28A4